MSVDTKSDLYQAKANFDEIYNQSDPRSYYRTLGALGYEIPARGALVFDRLLGEMGGREGKTVLDVCCGYSPNTALLNYEVDLGDLYEHYAGIDAAADPATVAEIDRRWFAERRRPDAAVTVGLDVAGNAVRYATTVGLLDHGVIADLESEPLDGEAARAVAGADLVTVTGGVGYIGSRTFETIIEATDGEPPWIAALSLRWVDFTPIAETLDDLGLVTEQLEGYCVPQRQFASVKEREAALMGLRARGLDPSEELRSGAHCAELFVARPPGAVRKAPIEEVLGHLTAG